MLRKIGFLTEEQFQSAARRSRLSEKGISAAHRVLVARESQSAVSRDIDVSREKVRQYCHAIYRRHVAHTSCPEGWISTTICLPREHLKEILTLEAKLRMDYERKRPPLEEAPSPKAKKAKASKKTSSPSERTDD